MDARDLGSRLLITVGGIAMLAGAIDPLEGSLAILPGSGLVALGAILGRRERRVITFRLLVLILIALGAGAMFGLSVIGGFGGSSGRSDWWGLLVLPYPIGWSMGIWGPGAPRWMLWSGIGVSLWQLTMLATVVGEQVTQPAVTRPIFGSPMIVLACIGLLTIFGCVRALRKRTSSGSGPSSAAP